MDPEKMARMDFHAIQHNQPHTDRGPGECLLVNYECSLPNTGERLIAGTQGTCPIVIGRNDCAKSAYRENILDRT